MGYIFARLIDMNRIGDTVPDTYSSDEIASMLLSGAIVEAQPAGSDYAGLKVDELRELAKDAGITGYAKMKKAELVEALSGDD